MYVFFCNIETMLYLNLQFIIELLSIIIGSYGRLTFCLTSSLLNKDFNIFLKGNTIIIIIITATYVQLKPLVEETSAQFGKTMGTVMVFKFLPLLGKSIKPGTHCMDFNFIVTLQTQTSDRLST